MLHISDLSLLSNNKLARHYWSQTCHIRIKRKSGIPFLVPVLVLFKLWIYIPRFMSICERKVSQLINNKTKCFRLRQLMKLRESATEIWWRKTLILFSWTILELEQHLLCLDWSSIELNFITDAITDQGNKSFTNLARFNPDHSGCDTMCRCCGWCFCLVSDKETEETETAFQQR